MLYLSTNPRSVCLQLIQVDFPRNMELRLEYSADLGNRTRVCLTQSFEVSEVVETALEWAQLRRSDRLQHLLFTLTLDFMLA